MIRPLLDAALRLLKLLGVFAACRRLKRPGVLILGYYGISAADEHAYLPGLFMRRAAFLRRLQLVRRWSLRVVEVDTALRALDGAELHEDLIVLTPDDGWSSCRPALLECRQRLGLPVTLDVTTYRVGPLSSVVSGDLHRELSHHPPLTIVPGDSSGTDVTNMAPHRSPVASLSPRASFPRRGDKRGRTPDTAWAPHPA
jgi:hypothetical protein